MCSTIIHELREILKKAKAQLKSHVLLAAPYIADDIPYTFHTHDTFELLLDLSDLLKAAKIQLDKLQALDTIALSIIEENIDTRRSTDSKEPKELVEDCSQTGDLTFLTESNSRMVDVQLQTETNRDGVSTSGLLDQNPVTHDGCSEGDFRADGQPSRTPTNTIEPCLSQEKDTPDCRVDTRTDVDDKCCHTLTSICALPSVNGIRQIHCPTTKNVILQTDARLGCPSERIEVDESRPQADKNVPVVEAIKETKKPTASLVHTCNQTIKQGGTDSSQNLVPYMFINTFDSDEDTDASSALLDQIPMATDMDLIDHPLKQHTSESLVPKASTTKKRLKPSHKARRAPDPPQSEVLKRQFRLQEANKKVASSLFTLITKSTGSDDIEYPIDLNPFQDDTIPAV